MDGFSDFARGGGVAESVGGEVRDSMRSAAEQAAAGVWGHSCQMGAQCKFLSSINTQYEK
jgi:hypothetical protein